MEKNTAESNSTAGRIDIATDAELTDKTECRLTSTIVVENFNQASFPFQSSVSSQVEIKRPVPDNEKIDQLIVTRFIISVLIYRSATN